LQVCLAVDEHGLEWEHGLRLEVYEENVVDAKKQRDGSKLCFNGHHSYANFVGTSITKMIV